MASTFASAGASLPAAPTALLTSAGVALIGCHSQGPGAQTPGPDERRLPATEVVDRGFAAAVHQLLRHGVHTPERSALLAGVVRRQMEHATALFEAGEDIRGTSAVVGALYLLRVGEHRGDMFDAASVRALEGAVKRFSARGDEGRALALMLMWRQLLDEGSPERADLERHVEALQKWMADTRTGGDMARLAAEERAAIGRSLLDPTTETLDAAAHAIDAWVERAVRYNLVYQRTRQLPPREEVAEAYRALQSGGETMAALFLRHGRAREALEMLEASAAGKVTSPAFFAKLRAAALDDTAEDWRLLARDFARLAFGEGELQMDSALVEAALWGIAVEAYRRDPQSLAIGHVLADQLIVHEMPEVAPLVLRDALGAKPSLVSLSAVMATVAESLSNQYPTSNVAVARRIFAASAPLLELAEEEDYQGRLKPSAAQLRQLMAGIELRKGHVDAARPLVMKALESEPTVWGYTMLATLERQMGNLEVALQLTERAAKLPMARSLPLDVADAKLLDFEIHRDRGSAERAQAALDQALALTLATRNAGSAEDAVRAERLLARVLDAYGESGDAKRAIERALDIASQHREILGATVLSAVGRALVHKNLIAARAALGMGIKADVGQSDLVYGALWLMLLEQEQGETPDGKVERVLLDAIHDEGWTGHLARWARGMEDDAGLRQSAASFAEQVEAEFYISMRRRVKGIQEANAELQRIANNPLIDLMEVQLARDLLAPKVDAKIPATVKVP
ncbi:MAG: hypothetical protein R3B72_10490 [Polyangiaceae bacterium]